MDIGKKTVRGERERVSDGECIINEHSKLTIHPMYMYM